MLEFSTVEEKAKEWNVSTRAVQILCSKGKIVGATKRAGIWIIPKESQKPADGRKR
jgi:hypothetical protein